MSTHGASARRGSSDPRGRSAERPRDIPARGWKEIGKRVLREASNDKLTLLAAGVAFYAMLAFVPGLVAVVTIYGLVADPATLQQQIDPIAAQLPGGAAQLLRDQLSSIVGSETGSLTFALVISLLAALWSAASGTQGLMQAVNVAYDEDETRSAVKLKVLAIGVTFVVLVGFLLAFALIGILPAMVDSLGLGSVGRTLVQIGRWPLLALLAMTAFGVVYRYAPDRDPARWRWVSWGSVVATIVWLGVSALFSIYVANFGSYQETYGALAAVVVMLLWLWLTALAILLGAELNAEMEHQTRADTTRGRPEPPGRRGAYVADHAPN